MRILRLKMVGAEPGYCRVYYRSARGYLYCRQEEYQGIFRWYTCTEDCGEPCDSLRNVTIFLNQSVPCALLPGKAF